ncbi:helix-turn-helix domain-containing protein [Duganella zoogloeoides]|uniref:Helix-turn-helix domain-containing protein n=1 Tax=Duganella zoogloeoides TaxID=75659 RepID=A0ABZ0Y0F3_9BURK|nr:helix-turn-helix domain-containing protein [Duganella zoogloeoides]WQH05331.1 helix-turn-helix domain-containing protein [Duganella zoogloeoides]
MNTLNLLQASAFLHIHKEELRKRAKQGLIPGVKIGRAWIFLEEDLVAYIRAHYPEPRQAMRVTLGKEYQSCHSTSAETPGGSASRRRQESALDTLLAPATKRRRSGTTTN